MSKSNREELLKRQSPEYLKYLKENNLEDFFVDTIKVLQGDKKTTFTKYLSLPNDSKKKEKSLAFGWKKLSNSSSYNYAKTNKILLDKSLSIAKIIGEKSTFIDFGVGNNIGLAKTIALIKDFKNIEKYIPLDSNKNYIDNAINKILNLYPQIKTEAGLGDFFNWKPKKSIKNPVALCFGGTFANINEKEHSKKYENIVSKLSNLRQILGQNAFLIISQDTCNKTKELKKQYVPEVCENWLRTVFFDIKFKLKVTEIEIKNFNYTPEFRKKNYLYAHCMKSLKSLKIKIGNEKISIQKNQVFEMLRSYKYPTKVFEKILKKSSWEVEKSFTDSNKIVFFVCKAN
ncbi:MAG: L-histidine N(alpha)-methyltransferase [Alphaproteobacteria bacterium]|nr:MAG: hypothetical protein B6I23_01355 [Rickettsiaceae bacterium 4572_127]